MLRDNYKKIAIVKPMSSSNQEDVTHISFSFVEPNFKYSKIFFRIKIVSRYFEERIIILDNSKFTKEENVISTPIYGGNVMLQIDEIQKNKIIVFYRELDEAETRERTLEEVIFIE